MLKLIVYIFAHLFVLILSQSDSSVMGPGMWSLISTEQCEEESEAYLLHMDVKKHKINRTHDGISASVVADNDIDDTFAVYINVCKHVDGGCKQYQVISDDSIVNLAHKHAKNNIMKAFELAGVDSADFPLPTGEYEIEDFIVDYCEFPTQSPYGKYEAEFFLIKNGDNVACLNIVVEFTKPEDDEELC